MSIRLGSGVGLSGALVVALLCTSSRVQAQGSARIRYRAPSDCPSEDAFIAAVAERGGHLETPPSAERRFDITIRKAEVGFTGSLGVRAEGELSDPREVQGGSCAEVVDALAVVTAIALSAQPEAPAPEPAHDEPRVVTAAQATPAPIEPKRAPLRGAGDVWNKSIEVGPGTVHLDRSVAVTAYVGPEWGPAPGHVLPRLDLNATRTNFVTVPDGRSYLLGTTVRLRASFLFDQTFQFGDLKTTVGGQEVGASLCYSPHYDTDGLAVLLCGEIAAGLLALETKNAAGAKTQTKSLGFGAVGLGLETQYAFAGRFQIGLKLGAEAPTDRLTAERPDGSQLFRSSGVFTSGMLGLGVHF